MAIKEYNKESINYQEFREEYRMLFPVIKALLLTYLPKVTIEHIGSTAIPQLFGKNVLDILVIDHENNPQEIDDQLDALGFTRIEPKANRIAPLYCGSIHFNHQIFNIHVFVTDNESALHKSSMRIKNALLNVPEYRKAMEECHSKASQSGKVNKKEYQSMKGDVFEEILNQD